MRCDAMLSVWDAMRRCGVCSSSRRRCDADAMRFRAQQGSFEAVIARCSGGAGTEDPEVWGDAVERYSSEGCYVIALACREVGAGEVESISREDAESGLSLLGLLAFRNEPKPDSLEHITELTRGGVECVMVTGDSALTGACAPREACGCRESVVDVVCCLVGFTGCVLCVAWG
eukprot:2241252-Rhodomonas_salina.2